MRTVPALPLALALLGAASPLVAQRAVLAVPPDRGPADSLPPEERAERMRELDRLRRRARFGWRDQPGAEVAPSPFADSLARIATGGGFPVRVLTDAPEYRVGEVPEESDPMFLQITSEQSGYLTLLSGGTGRDLTVLAPNGLVPQLPVAAGVPLLFPLREWIVQGVELRPQLPDDVDESQQAIIAVVTRRPVPLPLFDPGIGGWVADPGGITLRTFQAWLALIPATERGLGRAFYLVRRR